MILAVLPFHLPLLQHLSTGAMATGFLQYDAPYYLANARAIFERGNGFAYPNAYDPDPHAPVIYFHWLLWLLGAGVKFLHLDPGALFATVGVAASIICGALTLRLVELVLPNPHGRHWWYLFTMWGGGIVVLSGMTLNLFQGRPLLDEVFRLDAGEGWWFSNWGRNLILPTEAVYHCLVAAAWIGVLQKRSTLAIVAGAALAATHPFSGLQHLLILGIWFGAQALRERTAAAWRRAGVLFALGIFFCAYYFWFLNLFPAHRALIAVWSTAHEITGLNLLLAIGPLAGIAAWRLYHNPSESKENTWFWITAFGVTFLLMKHDWFVSPHQPAHFSRGYHWLPVCFLALPQLQAWGQRLTASCRTLTVALVLGVTAAFAVADNVVFIAHDLQGGERDRIRLTSGQREMFAWLDERKMRGVMLCFDSRVGYCAAVYTGVRPYLGHLNNTPDVRGRWRKISAWWRKGATGPWLETIDYLLIEPPNLPVALDPSQWHELHRNEEMILLGRGPKSTPSASP